MENKFARRLHYLRKENGMSMDELCKQLAERFGYKTNKSMISKYENGVHDPNFSFIDYTAELFGVTVDYLMGRSDQKYPTLLNLSKKIPVMGTIAAGQPILAQEHIEGYEYVDQDERIDFCLKVKGDSMINARIYDGDIVFIHKQDDVENGEIAAVLIDGEEATLKRVYKVNGTVILRPENPKYKDFVFSKKDMKDVKILGKAISFKSEVK